MRLLLAFCGQRRPLLKGLASRSAAQIAPLVPLSSLYCSPPSHVASASRSSPEGPLRPLGHLPPEDEVVMAADVSAMSCSDCGSVESGINYPCAGSRSRAALDPEVQLRGIPARPSRPLLLGARRSDPKISDGALSLSALAARIASWLCVLAHPEHPVEELLLRRHSRLP